MFDRPVGKLGSNQNIDQSRNGEKPSDPAKRTLPIERRFRESSLKLALAQINTYRNQDQPREEQCR
jgi:hypothetical protein